MPRIIFLLLLLGPSFVRAFPDTIRHGYANCTTCHVSPAGGGILNSYGRSLSRELLSTWGAENEEKILHGLVEIPESTLNNFLLGGDARYLNRQSKTSTSEVMEGFWMQAQLRLGLAYEKVKFLLTLGQLDNPRDSQNVRWLSPEYFGLYTLAENLHFRVGRFEPVYGLRMPDHNLLVKSELGFVPWLQRDTAELIYEGETQFLSLAGFQALSSVDPSLQMTGYTVTFDQVLFEKNRVGVSAMNAEGQGARRRSLGLHGIVSGGESLFALFDFSRAWVSDSTKDVAFLRLGSEVYKGIIPFIQGQVRFDRIDNQKDLKKYGAGLIWLPRPHFEFLLQTEKSESQRGNSTENLLLVHYYL